MVGTVRLDGNGNFTMTQSVFSTSNSSSNSSSTPSLQRATATGTYTIGQDCSLVLKFATSTGSNSSNFTAPTSFRVQMVDSSTGQLSIQTDANTSILTGIFTAQ